jgi:hypothetical protein
VPAGAGNFSLHHHVQNGSGTHPASYPMGTRDFSVGVKRPRREADHSPPSSAEVKNAQSYTSAPQYAFVVWCQVKRSTGTTLPYIYIQISVHCCRSALFCKPTNQCTLLWESLANNLSEENSIASIANLTSLFVRLYLSGYILWRYRSESCPHHTLF